MSTLPNLLVTGGAGFIGSTFVAQMAEKGHRVIVLDIMSYAGHRENLNWIPKNKGAENVELVVGSITDGSLVSRLLKQYEIGAVVDFAAESHVDNSIERPADFIETNIVGCYTMLEAARNYITSLTEKERLKFRFLHVSTDEVYGSLGETGHFTENSPMRPNSPYSASKAGADLLCRAWHKTYGLPVIVTNCSNNYGPRQYPEKLIPLMITNALKGEKLPVYGDGRNVRDWIHVEDHSNGIYLALTRGQPGETYAFGGEAEKSNIDVVNTICSLLDNMVPRAKGTSYKELISFVKDRLGHDFRYAIDDSKAKEVLGFKRAHTFETGMEATVKWYLDNTEWCEAVLGKKKVA
ncbi:MAG: dTDP-glucose 4,6-dehydratase [Rickettsiales bacterium]